MACKRNITETERQRISAMGKERMDLAKSLKEMDDSRMPWTYYVAQASTQLKGANLSPMRTMPKKKSTPKAASKETKPVAKKGFFQRLFCK